MRGPSQFWLIASLLLLFSGCVESSGGELSPLSGLDTGPGGCGDGADCPAGSVCHPSGVCIQCPGGRCSGDAAVPNPLMDLGSSAQDMAAVGGIDMTVFDGAMSADADPQSEDMGIIEPSSDTSPPQNDVSTPSCEPSAEVCNNLDDDCDSRIDEDFDVDTDPQNCGACGRVCALPNAVNVCEDGQCDFRDCLQGYRNIDDLTENGCEVVEDRLELLSPGLDEALNSDFTIQVRVNGVDAIGHVEFRAGGQLLARRAPMEEMSIEVSIAEFEEGPQVIMVSVFDFDGEVLERVQSNLMIDRTAPLLSILQPVGVLIQGAAPFDLVVNIVDTAQPVRLSGQFGDFELPILEQAPYVYRIDPREIGAGEHQLELHGLDRAGNRGELSQNVRLSFCYEDAVALIPGRQVEIDRYENSRPDASRDNAGQDESLTCSQGNVLPWSQVDYFTAETACESVGKRLCTPEEWRRACEGLNRNAFPYGARWDRNRCNGQASQEGGRPIATGGLEACHTADDIFDLSGNLAEWTSLDAIGRGVNGGHFLSVSQERLRCDSREVLDPLTNRDTQGFRCCRDL